MPRSLSPTRVRILKRMARDLTEAQRRALAWAVGSSYELRRLWCIEVDAKTHDALVRKGLITEAPGRIAVTELGRSALAAAEGVRG